MNAKENPTISIVLMVKNEEHNIAPYFETIRGVADELVVVDTGSTDGTLETINRYAVQASFPVRIFRYVQAKFHDGATREYASKQCLKEYVLQLDTDERLSEGFKKNIRPFLQRYQPDVVKIPRIDELVPHFIDIMDYRLYRRGSDTHYTTRPEDAVHPHVTYSSKPILFEESIIHVQGKNHWLRRPQRIFDQLAREIEEVPNTRGLAREIFRGILGFYYKFRKTYFRQDARKDGRAGLKFAFMKGIYVFLGHFFVGLKPRTPKTHVHENLPTH